MNHDLWNEHQAARIAELERELKAARSDASRHRRRADYWTGRAIVAVTELRQLRDTGHRLKPRVGGPRPDLNLRHLPIPNGRTARP